MPSLATGRGLAQQKEWVILYFRLTLILCLIGALLLAGGASANNQPLKVATIHVPPFVVVHPETGKISGLAVTAARHQAAQCKTSLEFVLSPAWNRAYRMAADGIADGLLPTIYSADRGAVLVFPEHPILQTKMSLIARRSKNGQAFTGLTMLNRKRVGKLAGGLISDDFESYIRSNEVVVFQRHSYRSLLENLAAGRLDFVVGDRQVFKYYQREYGFNDKLERLEPILGTTPQYFALSRKSLAAHPDSKGLFECLLNQPVGRSVNPTAAD